MGQPDQRYLRNLVYAVAKAFKGSVGLYQLKSANFDPNTGIKESAESIVQVKRAAILPSESARGPGAAGSERPFQYAGLFDSRTRVFVVNRRDIPATFPVDNNMNVVYDHKRYQVKSIGEFGREALLITATWLEGLPARETVDLMGTDDVPFDDAAATDGALRGSDSFPARDGHVLVVNGAITVTENAPFGDS